MEKYTQLQTIDWFALTRETRVFIMHEFSLVQLNTLGPNEWMMEDLDTFGGCAVSCRI